MSLPLHERIRRDIEADILAGRLVPGERIPFEHDLAARYGCARMTVSRALSALAEARLIDRRRRAGSFVARPATHAMVLDIPDLEAEVRGRGEDYRFELTQRRVAPGDFAPGPLMTLAGVHRADGRGFACERRVIALNAVPEAEAVDFDAISPGAWLLAHVPWTEAATRFDAVNADGETARALDLAPRTACLRIERQTWRGGDRITRVHQTFAPGAHEIVARFGRR